ncbi:50S ribosomal protein L19 [Candidatus Uhrbacteria bacterium RIFCSPLOWO2_02_FULL_48_12]|uniref:50S ribosomal protein L19 n=1 Tax=Candidatus Uhrbacteria bacterium RIFCSPLOWO2_02_FULL_48_12 TaxID=1802407 RepID=A0A1F7V7P2_9BACT|nr:MAG: 50S ribosomal protein L19 [Candidatus Uhrbacteria bacterium RIFCSPLOWO2_02_FULL_48_12]
MSDKKVIYPAVQPGTLIRVHQKIKETTPKGEEKERVQVFEGTVLARRHGSEPGATITVRKISEGIGVEKIYPLHMPSITKIDVKKRYRVRRAKLNFLRTSKKKLTEIKEKR